MKKETDLPEEGMPDPIAGYKEILHVVGVDSSGTEKDFFFSQVAGPIHRDSRLYMRPGSKEDE